MESAFRFRSVPIAGNIVLTLILLGVGGCSTVSGQEETMERQKEAVLATQTGDATFYARNSQGDKTASGVRMDNRKAVAAHRTYPFGTVARVTNLQNGRTVNVVIVDRGPYGKNRREGAIIDLSRTAAADLGLIHEGQVKVKVEVLAWGNGDPLN